MRAPGSMSVLVQVALLAAFAVIASQVVAFVVVLTAPPPRPSGFSVAAAAEALAGRPAETADGRALRRTLSADAPTDAPTTGPVERVMAMGLAQRLNLPPEAVRVRLAPDAPSRELMMTRRGPAPLIVRPRSPQDPTVERTESFVFTQRAEDGSVPREALVAGLNEALARHSPPTGPGDSVQVITTGDRQTRFTVTADRLTFAPFSASARLPDGRWATVEPPRGWVDPWQARLLMALGITALLLAPVVWLMARRLTRPIRVFAQAAERLGADPDAEPLSPSGPSEVRTAIAAFNDMQDAIRQHMRQRTQTIAAIAHDLRTPLTRLRFRAEQAPDALRDRMAADVEEMDALIAQAMAFVRGEQQVERREPLDLAVLAADCAAGFAETGADVTFEGADPLSVLGDPAALRRALANLIDNAVTFAGSARVAAKREGDTAVIRISDNGPGLPPSELETAFEPFYRGERSRSRQTGGAGLGLAVARQAARAVGGDVVLSNRPGGGLEARLTVPMASGAVTRSFAL
jgi:two-component system, OmpR family, sensor kinase